MNTRTYTPAQLSEAHNLYMQGAPQDYITEKTGVNYPRQALLYYGMEIPLGKDRERLTKQWRYERADWSLLDGIKPVRNPPRGYSTFTRSEGERIRSFYMSQGVPIIGIARHLKVTKHAVRSVVDRQTNYTRKAKPTARGKAQYKRNKQRREGGRPWKAGEE